MTTELTLFTATLVQDSALSVSGLDRGGAGSRRPFTIVDGRPVLTGRGIKGALVAMASRFFDPLPRTVSDKPTNSALRRSIWECRDTTPVEPGPIVPVLRAGVGIRQKTGGRADGVLHDRELIPAGTAWNLAIGVNWRYAESDDDARLGEGILGYVLDRHWREGRCWLGGDIARGLGWCHLDNLQAYRLTRDDRRRWIDSSRELLPDPLGTVPTATPSRNWFLRTLDVDITFGEYRPGSDHDTWGLDMLAVGSHDLDRGTQETGTGTWALTPWAADTDPSSLPTDRAIVMSNGKPVLPGSSVRGPLRHMLSRNKRAVEGLEVIDPNGRTADGDRPTVGDDDPVGGVFGTVVTSSGVLIRDAIAEGGWSAARLHMHAEDEFTAGSYGSAKRDAVRVLAGTFPVRIVVEAEKEETLESRIRAINELVAIGSVGHLPVGGHKTRGAGWGRWSTEGWKNDDVHGVKPPEHASDAAEQQPPAIDVAETSKKSPMTASGESVWKEYRGGQPVRTGLNIRTGTCVVDGPFTLAAAWAQASEQCSGENPVAWWCEPTIDFSVTTAPTVFGTGRPGSDSRTDTELRVDEVCVFFERALWRAVQTTTGVRWVHMSEAAPGDGDEVFELVRTPAQLHGGAGRFAIDGLGRTIYVVREWKRQGSSLGFTINGAR